MSKFKQNIPSADILMGSLRSIGYSFESAIADIIDNSIAASADQIHILFPILEDQVLAVGILDNGIGMDADTLFEAMRYGSTGVEEVRNENDLGRFGLGLKSASLSQCRVLTVVSKKNGKTNALVWNYDTIKKKRDWQVEELNETEISALPYIEELNKTEHGTLVIWREFDLLSQTSKASVYDALNLLKDVVAKYVSLIFHRYISESGADAISIFVNNYKVEPQDPFLESHKRTTIFPEETLTVNDSNKVKRQIKISAFILPYITDLSEQDKKLIGGVEDLRIKQGFYIYRNKRLIIWGTWFGMKSRAELTKNARIRVDIPNSLDDIWSIDIKKQSATIPKRIQNNLKDIVRRTLEKSTKKETFRGRPEKIDDQRDYIWDRMCGRQGTYFYQINRESYLYQYIKEKISDRDYHYLEMLLSEIEKNIPLQQIYVDRANNAVVEEETASREDDVFVKGIELIEYLKETSPNKHVDEIINKIMLSEPFFNYPNIKQRFKEQYHD